MTVRKADIRLAPRLTAYLTREEVAGELRVSPPTVDEIVTRKLLPKPKLIGPSKNLPRWRWEDVDKAICNDDTAPSEEPYFREQSSGTQKDGKRDTA